jgi:hypothetical protein
MNQHRSADVKKRLIYVKNGPLMGSSSLGWMTQQTESDIGFLDVLDKMKSWSESSSEGASIS